MLIQRKTYIDKQGFEIVDVKQERAVPRGTRNVQVNQNRKLMVPKMRKRSSMRLTSNSPKMCIKEPTEFDTDLVFNPMRKLGDSFRITSNIK